MLIDLSGCRGVFTGYFNLEVKVCRTLLDSGF